MTRFSLFIIALLLAIPVQGEVTPDMCQAIVRISNAGSSGSGCLVGKDSQSGLVVTCQHLFTDGASPVVSFLNGEQLQGELLFADPVNDLAAIRIPMPKAEPIPLANYRPAKGERIYSAGFGSPKTNKLSINTGTVFRYLDRGDGSFPGIKISGTSRAGDSGGPMINEQGEVAAVLWGGSEDGVVGTSSDRLSYFLTQCPPGSVCPPYRIQQPQQPQWQPQVRPIRPPARDFDEPDTRAPLVDVPSKPSSPLCKSCECDNSILLARIESLEKELHLIASRPPAVGPKGDPGERGPIGPIGVGLPAPAPNVEVVVVEAVKRLKNLPITFQNIDPTDPNKLLGPPVKAYLGESVALQLSESK